MRRNSNTKTCFCKVLSLPYFGHMEGEMNPPINVRICSNSGHNCRIGSRASNAETLATHLHNRWEGGQFEIIQPTEAYSYEHILLLLMLHHYGTDSTKSFDWLTMPGLPGFFCSWIPNFQQLDAKIKSEIPNFLWFLLETRNKLSISGNLLYP